MTSPRNVKRRNSGNFFVEEVLNAETLDKILAFNELTINDKVAAASAATINLAKKAISNLLPSHVGTFFPTTAALSLLKKIGIYELHRNNYSDAKIYFEAFLSFKTSITKDDLERVSALLIKSRNASAVIVPVVPTALTTTFRS